MITLNRSFFPVIGHMVICYRWWIGPWQLCPVTCGEKAVRRRTVLCVSGERELAMPDAECAGQTRPADLEPCPDTPLCLPPSLLASLADNTSRAFHDRESANRYSN